MSTLFYILLVTFPCNVSTHVCSDVNVYTSLSQCIDAGQQLTQGRFWRCKPMQITTQEESDGRHVYVDLRND